MASTSFADVNCSSEDDEYTYEDGEVVQETSMVDNHTPFKRTISYQIATKENMDSIADEKIRIVSEYLNISREYAQTCLLQHDWNEQKTIERFTEQMNSLVANSTCFYKSDTMKCSLQSSVEEDTSVRVSKRRRKGPSLRQQFLSLKRNKDFTVEGVQDEMTELKITFDGPEGSHWEGIPCSFVVSLEKDFPFSSPKSIRAVSNLFHPNICGKGNVCLGMVSSWSPNYGLVDVGHALKNLMRNPNWNDAVNMEAVNIYRENEGAFLNYLKKAIAHGTSKKSVKVNMAAPGSTSSGMDSCDNYAKCSLACGHYFCKKCWSQYLSAKVRERGKGFIYETCMANGCDMLINENLVNFVCDENIKRNYKVYLKQSMIEKDKSCKYCPNERCEKIVYYPNKSSNTKTIVCTCGESFCWGCTKACHEPVSCQVVQAWAQEANFKSTVITDNLPSITERIMGKIKTCLGDYQINMTREQEQIEEKLRGVADQSKSVMANYLDSDTFGKNAKPCPSCNSAVYKTSGCNHMRCLCRYEFCWICLKKYGHENDMDVCDGHCNNRNRHERRLRRRAEILRSASEKFRNVSVETSFTNIFNDVASYVSFPAYDAALTEFLAIEKLQADIQAKCEAISGAVPLYSSTFSQIKGSLNKALNVKKWLVVSDYFAGTPISQGTTLQGDIGNILPSMDKLLCSSLVHLNNALPALRQLTDRIEHIYDTCCKEKLEEQEEQPDIMVTAKLKFGDLKINDSLLEKKFNFWKRKQQEHDGPNGHRRHMMGRERERGRDYRRYRGRTLVQMISDLEQRGFPADSIDCMSRADLERFLEAAQRGDLTPSNLIRAKANFAEDHGSTPDSVTVRSLLISRVPLCIWCMPPERLLQGKKNYASHYGRDVRSVHIQELFETVAGIHAWCNFTAIENEGSERKPNSAIFGREEKKRRVFTAVETGSESKVKITIPDREDLP